MDSNFWQRVEELFNETLKLTPDKREAYLDDACGADAELRAEVESLVREAEEQPEEFLSEPVASLAVQLLEHRLSETLAGQTLGAYTILRLIGRGGMGEVYLAYDERLERRVAVKLLPISLTENEERVQRFKHEARAASAISHPNVAAVYEIGEEDGRIFTAMEYVEGLTLRERLSWGTLKLGGALEIAKQVAAGIVAAHAEGVVHRDIKPENILLRRDGFAKVVDFGLAKLTEPQGDLPHPGAHETQAAGRVTRVIHTELDTQMGTPNYMSPEQARCQEVDARTDVWSLGVVFYEMLSGRTPFAGETKSDVIAEILKSPPPVLRAGLPESLTRLLRKALSKDRNDRHASMKELLGELSILSENIKAERLFELPLPLDGWTLPLDANEHKATPPATLQDVGLLETAPQANRFSDSANTVVTAPSWTTERGSSLFGILRLRNTTSSLPKTPASKRLLFEGVGAVMIAISFIVYNLAGRHTTVREAFNVLPQITHLTKDGRILDTAISGDGNLLVYAPIESGKFSIWVRDLRSGEEWQLLPLSPTLCWGMRFTPDAQELLYITTQPSSSVTELYSIPVRGGRSRRLAVNIDAPPAVSPDGTQVAFVRTYPTQHRDALIIAGTDGNSEREVASRQRPDGFSTSSASWSPDGRLVALGASRNNDTESAVIGIPVSGGEVIELTPWRWAAVAGVAWNADGRNLIFSARELGTRILQIWCLSLADGKTQHITDDGNEYEEVTLAPGAATLVTTHTYEVSDIWIVDSSGGRRRLTTQGHEGADGLAVTPAGRIVYTVGEYEQSKLWSMNADGGDRKRLTENNGFLPSASRDGHLIAYVSSDKGIYHVWLMDADGNNNRQLTDGSGEFSPSITPDGNWVVYASLADERSSLWKISTRGGRPLELSPGAFARRPVVSPDGTMVACAYRTGEEDELKIAVLPFAGGKPLKTFALPSARNQMIRWTPDSRALIYFDKRDGVHNLWRQPLDESTPSQITNFTEDLILHYNVLDTGTDFVLSRGGRRRDIALVKNFE